MSNWETHFIWNCWEIQVIISWHIPEYEKFPCDFVMAKRHGGNWKLKRLWIRMRIYKLTSDKNNTLKPETLNWRPCNNCLSSTSRSPWTYGLVSAVSKMKSFMTRFWETATSNGFYRYDCGYSVCVYLFIAYVYLSKWFFFVRICSRIFWYNNVIGETVVEPLNKIYFHSLLERKL